MSGAKQLRAVNVFYEVKNNNKKSRDRHIRLVNNISGTFRSGRLTALMGSSGCGKTSLLNLIVGNVESSSRTSGEITYIGEQRDPEKWIYQCSYLNQKEEYMAYLTVEETLTFYAEFLGLDNIKSRVKNIISDMDLVENKNTIMKSLSGGELRRACLGVELISDPDVLVLDEPTSGLDSHLALSLISTLRRYSLSGKTVVISIHQPGEAILSLIDDLYFIVRGSLFYRGEASNLKRFLAENEIHKPSTISTVEFLFCLQSNRNDEFLVEQIKKALLMENKKKTETLGLSTDAIGHDFDGRGIESPDVLKHNNGDPKIVYSSFIKDDGEIYKTVQRYRKKMDEIIEENRAKECEGNIKMTKEEYGYTNVNFSIRHIYLLIKRQVLQDLRSRKLAFIFFSKMLLIALLFAYMHEYVKYHLKKYEGSEGGCISLLPFGLPLKSYLDLKRFPFLQYVFYIVDYHLLMFINAFSIIEDDGFIFSNRENKFYSQLSIYWATLIYNAFFCVLRSAFVVLLFRCSDLSALVDSWFLTVIFAGPLSVVISFLLWRCLISNFYIMSVVRCLFFVSVTVLQSPTLSHNLSTLAVQYNWFKYVWPFTYLFFLCPHYFADSMLFVKSYDPSIGACIDGNLLFGGYFGFYPNITRSFSKVLKWFNRTNLSAYRLQVLTISSIAFVILFSQIALLVIHCSIIRTRLSNPLKGS